MKNKLINDLAVVLVLSLFAFGFISMICHGVSSGEATTSNYWKQYE